MVNSESVMGIKPGDSVLVIGYQVDEFMSGWWSALLLNHTFTLVSQAMFDH